MADCLMITSEDGTSAKPVGVIGGSSEGHDIINSAGTAMTQREGLQFASGCVEDDAVNGKTIYIEMIRISQENYNTLKANGQLKPGAKYFIYDAQPVAIDASNLPYSSSQSTKQKIDSFATVATSGSYNDLSNKPTIPSLQSVELLSNQQLSTTETVYNLADDYTKYSIIIFSVSWLGGIPSKYEMCLKGVIENLQINLNGIHSNAHATIVRFSSKTSIRALASDANVYLNVYGLK